MGAKTFGRLKGWLTFAPKQTISKYRSGRRDLIFRMNGVSAKV